MAKLNLSYDSSEIYYYCQRIGVFNKSFTTPRESTAVVQGVRQLSFDLKLFFVKKGIKYNKHLYIIRQLKILVTF